MGLSSSRMGFRHSPTPRPKRSRLLSVLVCGGGVEGASTSHSPSFQIDDDPGRLQMNSAPCHNPISSKFGNPQKESVLVSETEPVLSIPKIEQVASSRSNIEATEDSPVDNSSGSVETDNHHKGLYQSKDIISPHHISIDCRIRDIPSTSYEDQLPSPPVCANGRDNLDVTRGINSMIDSDIPQICSVVTQTCISDSCSDDMSIENHASELTAMHDFDSGSASPISGSPINFDMQNSDTSLDTIASGLAYVVSDREDGLADESSLHLDVTSFPPNTLSNSSAENSNREARHSSRRLFWDAFSRRNSRRRRDSRTLVFASEDSDDSSGSQDRWLFDFNGGYFDNRGGAETGTATLDSRTNSLNEHHWHSSSEIWGRLQSGRRWSDRRSNICPSGLHPNGTCSCESVLMADESGAHASISRIVMLAEALFEVLDEIHRQPLSLSLPIVSLPASESVVDSLPVKNHKKTHKTGDDEEQCYICLAEYEEGDTIRILPCHHEYHMICVDKWLKEIHGVCPLCRGDLRCIDASVSNTEIPSL